MAGNGARSSFPALLEIWTFPRHCLPAMGRGRKGAAGVLDTLGHFHLFFFHFFAVFFSPPNACMSCEVGCKNLEKSRI